MRRRPQSAIIPIINKDKHEININTSQTISKQQHQSFVAPKEHFEDQEQLYYSNLQLKQTTNELRYQNQKLKAQVSQLQVQSHPKLIEKVGIPISQNGECSIVPTLKEKVKQQRNLIEELQTDMQYQQKSIKFTKMSELQAEISNLQNEIQKLKLIIKSLLKVQDQEFIKDPNIIEKLSKFSILLNQQQNYISQLATENEKLKKEYQEVSNNNSQLMDQIKILTFERINYKKQFNQQTNTENDTKRSDYLEKRLVATLQQIDSLKGELVLYQNKQKLLNKQIKEQEKELKSNILELQKQKQQLEEQSQKKDQIIQDLNDRINITELLKQKSPQSATSVTQYMKKSFFPILNYQDQFTQFPEKQDNNLLIYPIDEFKLQILLQQLKYKIISLKLTKERIQMCFNYKQYVQLGEAIEIFMKSPFNFQNQDSIIICRYLIGEDQGTSQKMQLEDTQEVKEIIKKFHTHPKILSEYLTFKTINYQSYFIKLIYYQINKTIIPKKIYNSSEFILLLSQKYNFSYELIEYILMMNYLYLNEIEIIDWNKMTKILEEEYSLYRDNHNLTYYSNDCIRYIPNNYQKKTYSDDEDFNYQVIESRNSKSISQQQQNDEIIINKKTELQSKVQEIISNEQILTLSQFKYIDQQLKSSESRKPNITSDQFTYSQSEHPKATVKKQIESQQVSSEYSLQFNITNQYQSPQVFNTKMSPISEFESGNIKNVLRNLKYNETDMQENNEEYVEEYIEEYVEEL
ncbi:unnamed protein product [Paramecium primaurelia]|uniref:Uncharacterized protein n=1 Tax=Paramecium primaurelia TaxID=5886 RepID=A0A8S1QHW1_PARPR|nr:unnamed protein product [Paramecium primaurelia]